MIRYVCATLAAAVAAPAAAQDGGTAMPRMAMPTAASPSADPPAPEPPTDHYADRSFDPQAMADARDRMMRDQGGQRLAQVMFNLAELQARDGRDGYRWDGEGWFGGDIDRAVVKTEGSAAFGAPVAAAEAQFLFSHAVGPYFDLQAGVRHDFAPTPTRTYATIGVEGLAPYMFQTEAALFVSTQGLVLARAEAWYDQRLTQRLVLQPRVELNFAAQNDPATRTGRGLADAEIGLRLRYVLSRRFAPYVGLSYETTTGRTADYARIAGKDIATTALVAGVRFWF